MLTKSKATPGAVLASYRLRCLGEIRISDSEGNDCTPRGRKTRALLVYVLLSKGVPISRERLAALLWGDRGEDQARASVRQALYEVRALSGGAAPLLSVTREHVTANADAVVIDLDEVESLAQAQDVAALNGLLRQQQPALLADLDDITPDFDDWLRSERSQRIERMIALCVAAGQAVLTRQDYDAVRALVTTLEALDPLSEPVVRLGIQTDTACGDPAQAHRRYRRFQERLARDLATQPSAETRALLPRQQAVSSPETRELPPQEPAGSLLQEPPTRAASKSRSHLNRILVSLLAVIVLTAGGFAFWSYTRKHTGAQDLYLQAQTLMRDRRETDLSRARTLLLEATQIDPEYAAAWASLSIVTMLLSDEPNTYGPIPLAQARNQALHYANRAVTLNPNLATGHAALGLIWGRDERAIAYYQRAIAIDPQRAEYHRWLGQAYESNGRSPEAFKEFARAVEVEPRWPSSSTILIEQLAALNRENEIDNVVRRFNAASDSLYDRKVVQFEAYETRGELQPMISLGREMLRERPDESSIAATVAIALASLGDRQSALAIVQPEDVLLRAIIGHDVQQIERVARESPSIFWHEELDGFRAGELLVANGQGRLLLQLFDTRYGSLDRVKAEPDVFIKPAPALIVALREAGRAREAAELNRLMLDQLNADRARNLSPRAWAFDRAQHLALAGDSAAALADLESLERIRWTDFLVAPFTPLTDLVAFRELRSDPRMAALQQQLSEHIRLAREQLGPI